MTPFEVKSWSTIRDEILAWVAGNPSLVDGLLPTDLQVGSLERAHVEALAIALEELYYRFSIAIPEAISESCFNAFGFTKLAGSTAAGSVVFSSLTVATQPITIPQGTTLMTKAGVMFMTTAEGTIPLGSKVSGDVSVVASTLGTTGNVAAEAITVIPHAIPGVDAVTNADATTGGTGEETDEARRLRFARYIASLPRGTASALEFAALSASSSVAAARVVEPYLLTNPPDSCPYAGLVWLWVDAGSALNAAIQTLVEANVALWKAAGVRVLVKSATRMPITVKATVNVDDGSRARFETEMVPLLTQAALQYFAGLSIGESVSHNALLVALAGVDDAIQEVHLTIGKLGDPEPATTAPTDIAVENDSDPTSTGLRATLASGPYLEPRTGITVTLPHWSLA